MRSKRPLHLRVALACAGLLALAGCGVGDILDDDEDTFHIRSLNLIEDAATVNVLIDGTAIASVAYDGGTTFGAAHPGSRSVSFKAVLPASFDDDDEDDDPVAIGQAVTRSFAKDTPYTLIAYGTQASPQMFFIEGMSQRADVGEDKVVLQFAHASPQTSQVDVYVTLAQAGVTAPQFVATLDLTQASTPLELTLVENGDELDDDATLTGDLIVELRAAGSQQALFTSDEVSVTEQTRVLFTIADSKGPGPATTKVVSLVQGSTSEILDRDDDVALRLVHVSADTPALNVATSPTLSTPFASGVAFRGTSAYTTVNIYAGEVGLVGVSAADTANILFLEEFDATAGTTYSAYALGTLADVDAAVFADDSRSVPTQTKFRFLHAAASLLEADPLDIYLRLPGEAVDFDDDDTTPSYSSLAYQNTTSYATYEQGSYEVYFVSAGTSTVLLGPVPFELTNGDIDTFVLINNESGGYELMDVSDVRQ